MCFEQCYSSALWFLTHWGRVTHICVDKLTIIGSDNGLSPGRCQTTIWTNAGILLIGTNFSEILIRIQENALENVVCEMASNFVSASMCLKMGATLTCIAWKIILVGFGKWTFFLQPLACCIHFWKHKKSSWGQHGAHLGPVGPMLAPWTLLSGTSWSSSTPGIV